MTLKERFERLYDSFSFRQRAAEAADDLVPLPDRFRSRVLLFWRDLIDGTPAMRANFGYDSVLASFWEEMHNDLQHLYGRPYLLNPRSSDIVDGDLAPFLEGCETGQFFDFMELAFKLPVSRRLERRATEIVDALNEMFRVENLPYEMTHLVEHEETVVHQNVGGPPASRHSGPRPPITTIVTDAYPQVIRLDEQVPHSEAIRPALTALSAPHFKQANDEFRKALRHYRDGEFADCLTACGSALESTLKVICERNEWSFDANATLQPLIDTVVGKCELTPFFKTSLGVVGQLRNQWGDAHGRGSDAQPVPRHIAQYGLTSSAAAIILLITVTEADR